MPLSTRHLIGIKDLRVSDVEQILETATAFREIVNRPVRKVPTLRGKTIVNLFFEPSTRTRSSFEIAAKRLSADSLSLSVATSSVTKGETLVDTGLNLQAMHPDIIVIRHSHAGAPALLARHCTEASIVNAGDGRHEHPTQGLLDALTILDHKKRLDGLKVAIVGDISHSRVARSNVLLLTMMGSEVVVCGPPTLIPVDFDKLGARITYHLREAVEGADVVMMLRCQKERQNEVFYPTDKEYFQFFGMNKKRLRWAARDAIVMHPGPINRGVEIDPELADGESSVILHQVSNGVAVRMAVLYLLSGHTEGSGL